VSTDAPLLVAADLDRTLVPNGPEPESPGARDAFARFVASGGVVLAYVSGRDRRLVEEIMAAFDLPAPDFVIGDVGTTVWRVGNGTWDIDAGWRDHLAARWAGLGSAGIAALLAPMAALTMQEKHKQGEFKVSHYVAASARRDLLDNEVRRRLDDAGVNANRVWSMDQASNVQLLDILPAGADKLAALEYVGECTGIAGENMLFAGDSGNDIAVLASALPSVLVANALPEVARDALAASRAAGTTERLYIARGGFLGMNGNYAAGILEGIAHFFPERTAALRRAARAA